MKKKPLVSIVLPTYNGSQYIRQSIESCLNQTYQNIELIIVDDNSTDDTPSIIKEYTDKRIKYIHNETNKRLPSALNIGFLETKGDYLTWTSDDNFFLPEAIEKMVLFLKNQNYDFVYSSFYSLREGKNKSVELIQFPQGSSFKKVNYVRACFMYSRKVYEEVGDYDPDVELSEDYDYWIRVSRKFQIYYLNEPLYYYRYHDKALFSKRYWEQEVIKCLVRFKYDLYSKKEAVYTLINIFSRKRAKRISRPFIFLWGVLVLKRLINNLLIAYKMEQLSFKDYKQLVFEEIL